MADNVPSENKTSTLLFRIPHVSNLWVFWDAIHKPRAAVEMMIRILKIGCPEILYLGYDCFYSAHKEVMAKAKDSAIVRICLPGKEIIRKDPNRTLKLLIEELQKPRNCVSLASQTISPEKEIVAVAITVESINHQNRYYQDCAPLQGFQNF